MKVRGYRLLVKPRKVEDVSAGGIIVNVEGSNAAKLERNGNQYGTVFGIGHTCWKGNFKQDNWCEVGDEIIYSKHAGRFLYDRETEEEYLAINDDDVLVVYKKGADNNG